MTKERLRDEIEYLSADQEDRYFIAQCNEPIDEKGKFEREIIMARNRSDYPMVKSEDIQYMDVSPASDRVGGGIADSVP